MKVNWTAQAGQDRRETRSRIAQDNLPAAVELDNNITRKAERLARHPAMGRPGRLPETRELVVHSNYVLLYTVTDEAVVILRLLHARQRWPSDE